jgi:Arc/MetJ family transcription regulator
MSRTNIDIDDELVVLIMRRYNLSTKRKAVDFALRELAGRPLTTTEALALEGSGWEGDLEEMRAARSHV